MTEATVAQLVRRAADGDQAAWDALVERYSGLLWAIARAHRLGDGDAADVTQTAWLRLVEHLDRLNDPAAVGGWLATTARRECLRVLRRAGRQIPTDVDVLQLEDPDTPQPEEGIATKELEAALWRGFERLSDRCRTLLRVLMADPPPTYQEVGAALDMPVGSIGPTRGRCLQRLRVILEAEGISAETGGSFP